MEDKLSPNVSELELAGRIIDLHDHVGLGFRKISGKLSSEGFKVSKDRAFRLYHKYKVPRKFEQEIRDEKLQPLCQKMRKTEERVEHAKAKYDMQRRIVGSMLREADFDFTMRRRIFQKKKTLLDFAKKVLPVTNPALWLRLVNICAVCKINLANATQEAMGNQASYEEIRMECKKEGRDYLLHEYLSMTVDDWLSQKEPQDEETMDSLDSEEDTIITLDVTDAELSRIMKAQHAMESS